jgi:hypothetical protein
MELASTRRSLAFITSKDIEDFAVTDAVRLPRSNAAISPRKSPGPRPATCCPSRVTWPLPRRLEQRIARARERSRGSIQIPDGTAWADLPTRSELPEEKWREVHAWRRMAEWMPTPACMSAQRTCCSG